MSGINQLRALQNKDDLTLKIISAYEYLESHTLMNEKEMLHNMYDMVKLMQKYDWLRDFEVNGLNSEARDYILNNSEYINNLLWSYNRTYVNYLPSIEITLPTLKEVRNELRIKIYPDFKPDNKELLEEYTGVFVIDEKMKNENVVVPIDTLIVATYKDMLELDYEFYKSQFIKLRFIDDFSTGDNIFFSGNDYYKITMQFERNAEGSVSKLQVLRDVEDKEKTIYHLKKVNLSKDTNDE